MSAFAGFKLELRPRPTDRSDPASDPASDRDLAPGSVLGAGVDRPRQGDAVALGGHHAVPASSPSPSPAAGRRRRWPIRRLTLLVPGFTRLLGAIYLLTGILGFALGCTWASPARDPTTGSSGTADGPGGQSSATRSR